MKYLMINLFAGRIPTDSKQAFYKIIYDYYFQIATGKVPLELLKDLCSKVTDHYYKQYTSFRKLYPKSAKRYSTFQVKDLNHPQTFDILLKVFDEEEDVNYINYAVVLSGMTLEEIKHFKRNREGFVNMF